MKSAPNKEKMKSGAASLFGEGINSVDFQEKYIEMLTAMMKEYDGTNLFATVHKEKTIKDVQEWKIKKR